MGESERRPLDLHFHSRRSFVSGVGKRRKKGEGVSKDDKARRRRTDDEGEEDEKDYYFSKSERERESNRPPTIRSVPLSSASRLFPSFRPLLLLFLSLPPSTSPNFNRKQRRMSSSRGGGGGGGGPLFTSSLLLSLPLFTFPHPKKAREGDATAAPFRKRPAPKE